MHFRLVVLCRGYADRREVARVEARLERRLVVRKRIFDYVDFFERYSPNRFPEEFEERGFVAATYTWDGKRLRHLGPGLVLPRGWRKRYREVLVFDAHA